MTIGDSNDKVKAILLDAYNHPNDLRESVADTNSALMAMIVLELKRIADCMEAAQESGPR